MDFLWGHAELRRSSSNWKWFPRTWTSIFISAQWVQWTYLHWEELRCYKRQEPIHFLRQLSPEVCRPVSVQQHNSSLPQIWSDPISLSASWLFPLFFFGLYARKFPPPRLIQQTLFLCKDLLPCLIWEGGRCQLDTCDEEAGSFPTMGKSGWHFAQLCHIQQFCKLV